MRVGIVCSSAGHTFNQLCRGVEHLGVAFTVITDRQCGIEDVARTRKVPCRRIPGDRQEFSLRAAEAFASESVSFVLLYFNRLVSAELFAAIPTYNVHPSLLPAFAGLRALEEARTREVRFVGATLHLATEGADSGPIVAQVCTPVSPPCGENELAELSFVQRVYLSLLLVELEHEHALAAAPATGTLSWVAQRPHTDRCNPAIQDETMLSVVRELEEARGIRVTA